MTGKKRLANRLSKEIVGLAAQIFIFAVVAVAVVSIVAVGRESRSNSTKALKNTVLEIEKTLTEVESATQAMAVMVRKVYDNPAAMGFLTAELLDLSDAIIDCAMGYDPGEDGSARLIHMSYYDKKTGEVISRSSMDDGFDYSCSDWYLAAKLLDRPYWTDPRFDIAGSRQLVATFSYPVKLDDGTFVGVLRSDISLDWLSEAVDKFKPYEKSATILIGRNASFITHFEREKILNETIFTDIIGTGNERAIKVCQRILSGESVVKNMRMRGRMYNCVSSPISNGWSAMSFCSFTDFYEPVLRINILLLLIAIVGLISIFVVSRRRISKITMPITEFTYSALNMSKGFFQTHIPEVDSQDEIGHLRDSLAYLQKSLDSYLKQLREAKTSKERYESELSVANSIQMAMLPGNYPDKSVADIFACVKPAKEVGGDLYYFSVDGRCLTFAVGDVSGKGVPAALFMAIVGSLLRSAKGRDISLENAAYHINNIASDENEYGMFVTLFVGKVNLDTLEMEYCNCGHNPLLIVSPDGKPAYLKSKPNLAIGVFPDFKFEVEKIQLEKGSRIFAYTDGVTEAETASKDQFGEDRLLEFFGSLPAGTSSEETVGSLLDKIREFTAGNDQNDDITAMSIIV